MAKRSRPNRPRPIHPPLAKRAERQSPRHSRWCCAWSLAIALLALPSLPGSALAQAAPPPPPQAAPPQSVPATDASLTDLKAAAYDAQQNAAAAQQEAEQAAKALEEAEAAAAAAPPPPPPPPPPPVPAPVPVPVPVATTAPPAANVTQQELDALKAEVREAREAARHAGEQAMIARRELEEFKQKHKMRFARPGFFIAGGVFWSPALYDWIVDVSDGRGWSASAGYRFNERIEVSAQYEKFTGYEISGLGFSGDVDSWSAIANAKLFILTGSFQPYLGFGIGAFQASLDATDPDGFDIDDKETVVVFRISGGFEYYISEHLALTGDAAINLPGGYLTSMTYATLGGGLKIRF